MNAIIYFLAAENILMKVTFDVIWNTTIKGAASENADAKQIS